MVFFLQLPALFAEALNSSHENLFRNKLQFVQSSGTLGAKPGKPDGNVAATRAGRRAACNLAPGAARVCDVLTVLPALRLFLLSGLAFAAYAAHLFIAFLESQS
jgi:hypothetical protein